MLWIDDGSSRYARVVATSTDYLSTGAAWFTLVFLNTALAAALNRSRLLVFLVSIVLAPLVTVYLAIAGKRFLPPEQ